MSEELRRLKDAHDKAYDAMIGAIRTYEKDPSDATAHALIDAINEEATSGLALLTHPEFLSWISPS